jgi:hypothetical protein
LLCQDIPAFQSFAANNLLDACVAGRNDMESVLRKMRRKCSKSAFVTKRKEVIADCQAVAEFNIVIYTPQQIL